MTLGTTELYLSASDVDRSDAVDLSNNATCMVIGLKTPPPPAAKDGSYDDLPWNQFRTVTVTLAAFDKLAGSANVAMMVLNDIRSKLAQAHLNKGAYWVTTPVTLWVRSLTGSTWLLFDVWDGHLEYTWVDHGASPFYEATLTLRCLPYARTLAQQVSFGFTQGGLLSGAGCVVIPNVPGNVPALCAHVLTDTSINGAVINGWRIGRMASRGNVSGDWTGMLDINNVLAGSGVVDGTAVGGGYVHYQTSSQMVLFCDVGAPGNALEHGLYDVWVRLRDNAGGIATPTNLAAYYSNAGGTVPGGFNYQVLVTEIDGGGNETAAAGPVWVWVPAGGEIVVTWTVQGTPANHKVYVVQITEPTSLYSTFTTGLTSGSYTITTAPGGGTVAPQAASTAILNSVFQVAATMASSSPSANAWSYGPVFQSVIGGGRWEWVYAGLFMLPPLPRSELLGTDLSWLIGVSAASGSSGTPFVDVDAAMAFPHRQPQLECTFSGYGLATNRVWNIDSRRDGRSSCWLTSKADGSQQGQCRVVGHFTLGPGTSFVQYMPIIQGGVSDVQNAQWTGLIQYIPRWCDVTGLVPEM